MAYNNILFCDCVFQALFLLLEMAVKPQCITQWTQESSKDPKLEEKFYDVKFAFAIMPKSLSFLLRTIGFPALFGRMNHC